MMKMAAGLDGANEPIDGKELLHLQQLIGAQRSELELHGAPSMKHLRNCLLDLEGCESLDGTKILLVDDYPKEVLQYFLTHLILTTRRKIGILAYKEQDVDTFAAEVVHRARSHSRPDLILMDYELWLPEQQKGIYGSQVIRACHEQYQDYLPFVGFSSGCDLADKFEKVDASFAWKNFGANPAVTIHAIAMAYEKIMNHCSALH